LRNRRPHSEINFWAMQISRNSLTIASFNSGSMRLHAGNAQRQLFHFILRR
jgi:hypothetical protein